LETHKSPFVLGRAGKGSHMIIVTSSFWEGPFSKCFPFILKRQVDVLKFFRSEENSVKLHFRDGLLWKGDLMVGKKAAL